MVRHCSRASSPYLDVCPCPKVDNRPTGPELAYAPGNWPFVVQLFPSPDTGRTDTVTGRVLTPITGPAIDLLTGPVRGPSTSSPVP
ncbi:hypothetical protein GCM10009540_00330 [Streptomyces turgidiscabies]